MLQAIREKAQGWIAWAIVILISIPFALWGIQEYLGVGSDPEVATVEGQAVTERMLDQRMREVRESMRASLGASYRADLFDDNVLRAQVLDSMVEEMVMTERARAWNLRTSDLQARSYIASIPAFQRDGQFDQQAYDAIVRNRGMSRAGFEEGVRRDMMLAQMRAAISGSAFVTATDLDAIVRLRDQQRTYNLATIGAEAFKPQVEVSDDKLQDFYASNQASYRTPERVKLNYLLLDSASLGALVEVTEDGLRQYFEDHRAEFVGREERELKHILIAVNRDADEAATQEAQGRAQGLLDQIRAGADLSELAGEHSDDPGSAAAGGDLGWVEPGVMVPAFEAAAFALDNGAVSDLVRTDFGFHIIQVTGIRGGSDAGFDELRDEVDAAYRRFEAENLYFDYAERLAESAYENPASLAPAAEALGLEVMETAWVVREGPAPAGLDSSKVLDAAFSDDVLGEGNNSELIELDAQRAVVVRVAEHEPAGVRDFSAHRAVIEGDYVAAQASALAEAAGEEAQKRLARGDIGLTELAGERGWQLESHDSAARPEPGVPDEVGNAVFALARPPGDRPTFGGVVSANGDYVLIELLSVVDGDPASPDADADALVQRRQLRNADLNNLVRSLRSRASVELRLSNEL